MITCNDCIHSEVCIEVNADFSSSSKGEYDDCTEFKDTARFIELPCLVGDTVWTIMNKTVLEAKVVCILPLVRINQEIKINIVAAIIDAIYADGRFLGQEIFCTINEDTFVTKEDAEKKLKEII